MSRYHFHIANGDRTFDEDGTDLADFEEAQAQAVLFAASMLRDNPELLLKNTNWRVEVTDSEGCLLFTIAVLAITAPPHRSLS